MTSRISASVSVTRSAALVSRLRISALTSRSVDTRRAAPAFMAPLSALLISSRSTSTSLLRGNAVRPHPPPPYRNHGPYRLDKPERPGALHKSIDRSQCTSACERQNERGAAILERIADQHRRHCKQTECG